MSQEEILCFLKQNKGNMFFAKDLSKMLNIGENSITNNLKGMRKSKLVGFHKVARPNIRPTYVYYVWVKCKKHLIKIN